MKKQLFLSLIAAFLMVLGVNAQNNSYNMVIEMTDGTKINIGPNDIKNMSFTDGQLTVSGESIDDIKKEIAALKQKIDEQKNCECSAEIEELKYEIANLNTSDIVAIINVLQMQIKSLMDEIEKLKEGNGNNNQGNDDNPGGTDDNQSGNLDSRLFGTWWDGSSYEATGFKFERNGRYVYGEWKSYHEPFSWHRSEGTWSTEGNYLTTIRDDDQKTETFRYEITNDGQLHLYEKYEDGSEALEFRLKRME